MLKEKVFLGIFRPFNKIYVINLIPILLTTYLIIGFSVNVPIMDQWALPGFFQKLADGTINLQDLMAQHNEHRIAFPRIIFSVLAFASQWNIVWELLASLAMAAVTFLLLYKLAEETAKSSIQVYLLNYIPNFLMGTLIFSLSQYENWLWGFQLAWFSINLCLVSSIYILYRSRQWKIEYLWLIAAIPCFIASFSSAHGLLTWLATIPSVFSTRTSSQSRARQLSIWGSLFFLSLSLYLIGYSKPEGHPSLFFLLTNPFAGLNYFLSFIGSSLVLDKQFAFLIGLSVIIYFVFLTRYFLKPLRSKLISASPWLSLGLYSLLFAGLTTVGRAGFGVEQAMASRYRTVTVLFIVATLQLGAIALNTSRRKPGSGGLVTVRPKPGSFVVFKVLLGVVLLSFLINSYEVFRDVPRIKADRETAKYCLRLVKYMEDIPSHPCRGHLFPSLAFVQNAAPKLEAVGFRQLEHNLEFRELSSNPDGLGNSDVIGSRDSDVLIEQGAGIPVQGWAAYPGRGEVPPFILFSYNDQRSFFSLALVNLERPDVAKALGDGRYLRSGWQANLSSGDLPSGETLIRAWVFDPENRRFVELAGSRVVRLGE